MRDVLHFMVSYIVIVAAVMYAIFWLARQTSPQEIDALNFKIDVLENRVRRAEAALERVRHEEAIRNLKEIQHGCSNDN